MYSTFAEELSSNLILIWCAIPLLISVLYACGVEFLDSTSFWELIMRMIGYIGLIIGLFVLLSFVSHFGIDVLNELSTKFSKITKKDYKLSVYNAANDKIDRKTKALDFLPILTLIIFLLWTLLSCAFSTSKYMAFNGDIFRNEGFMTYMSYAGYILLGLTISNNSFLLKRIAVAFISVGTLLSVCVLLNDIESLSVFINKCLYPNLHSSVFYNSNHFAYYLLLATLVTAFLYLTSDIDHHKLMFILVYVLFIYTIIINDTFGVYLALFLTLLVFSLFEFIKPKFGFKKVFVLLCLFLFVSIASLIVTKNVLINFYTFFGDAFSFGNYMVGELNESEVASAGTGRGKLWINSVRAILDRPILGYGLDSGANVFMAYGITMDRPHNMLLQMALFTGVPGVILYYSTYIIGIVRLLRRRSDLSKVACASTFLVLGYTISSAFGNSMFYTSPYYLIIFGICLSFCLNGINKADKVI